MTETSPPTEIHPSSLERSKTFASRALAALISHRHLPWFLALTAIVLMLPALSGGLFGDDLIQRLTQFRPEQLPARAQDTGFVPNDSGQLSCVVRDLFGYLRDDDAAAKAMAYGIVPWWAPSAWKAALWRPVTAFTHWVDYRIFPNTPALMHAHNIAWYAALIFLAATLYRKIGNFAAGASSLATSSLIEVKVSLIAGIAACLYLLDKSTYFPVMYVANRGFFIALTFGLLCLHLHHQWRTSGSTVHLLLASFCLLLSILANEAGASTLAFLIAYELVLNNGSWRARILSLLPAAIVMAAWRIVYTGSGRGVRNFVGYIDPGYSPALFLKNILPRMNGLLGGQLSGIPPEIDFVLSPQNKILLALFFMLFIVGCTFVFLPTLREDRAARFWAVVTLLALIPAATVAALSKNLGFVALGAFGLVATFLVRFFNREQRWRLRPATRVLSWGFGIWFLIAHIPGALAARTLLSLITPVIPEVSAAAFENFPPAGDRRVIVMNDPGPFSAVLPFEYAYHGKALPKSVWNLCLGFSGIKVRRPDASTLVITANGPDLFHCPPLGPIHLCYAFKAGDDFLFTSHVWKKGDRIKGEEYSVEVEEVSARGLPCRVAFHFNGPLEASDRLWVYFEWRTLSHELFHLPAIGETVAIKGSRGFQDRR